MVEWDREIERARRMLRGVVEQITELAEPVEVLVHRKVDLPWPALPIALVTAFVYYSLSCLAELLTRANPRLVERIYDL